MITSLYAGLFGLLYIQITFDVIRHRRKHKVSVGFGKNQAVAQVASTHANFSSYVPFGLILIYLLEAGQMIPLPGIHFFAIAMLIGRTLHYVAFKGEMNFKVRIAGMILTIFPLVAMSVLNIYSYITA